MDPTTQREKIRAFAVYLDDQLNLMYARTDNPERTELDNANDLERLAETYGNENQLPSPLVILVLDQVYKANNGITYTELLMEVEVSGYVSRAIDSLKGVESISKDELRTNMKDLALAYVEENDLPESIVPRALKRAYDRI